TGRGSFGLRRPLAMMPALPVSGVALIVGIDRFMSDARALTSTISNAVAVIVVSKWEHACDHEVLISELGQGYAIAEAALERGEDLTLVTPAGVRVAPALPVA